MAQTTPQAQKQKSINLILPPGIGSFVTLLEPKPDDKGKMWFSLTLLYGKSRIAELEPLKKAIETVAVGFFGANAMQLMNGGVLRNPLRDGDLRYAQDAGLYKAFKNCFFVGARTSRKPQIIDAAKNEVFSDEDVYSGCLMRASVSIFGYNKAGNKGVALGLNNAQVLKKLERLDGRKSATDEFSEWTEEGSGGNGSADPLA